MVKKSLDADAFCDAIEEACDVLYDHLVLTGHSIDRAEEIIEDFENKFVEFVHYFVEEIDDDEN